MGINILDANQALTAGADLWVIEPPENGGWPLRIDWLLNFQGLRSDKHQPPQINSELFEILQATGLENNRKFTALDTPLLIGSDQHVPCRYVVVFRNHWAISKLAELARLLKINTLRLFPTKSQNADQILKQDLSSAQDLEFQIVLPS